MDPSLPRRHTLGPSGIRQELPRQQQQQHQHEDGVIMTGASLESAATDRAIITANLKKRTGRRNARPGDTKVWFAWWRHLVLYTAVETLFLCRLQSSSLCSIPAFPARKRRHPASKRCSRGPALMRYPLVRSPSLVR